MNKVVSKLHFNLLSPLFLFIIVYIGYSYFVGSGSIATLTPPSFQHWFGTDLTGDDVFIKSMNALGLEVLTLLIVLPVIYFSGLFIGMVLSYFSNDRVREFLLNLIHYWVTLPVLLIALFLLILLGAGQKNAIIVMIFVLIPTQALYVYNQLETVKQNEFVLAKMSYGFSKIYIYKNHLLQYIVSGFTGYTLARMPEIIMMNLALNFLGLGVQPPSSSFGRMLFDGLSFMFSAWWMWGFPVIIITSLFVGVSFSEKYIFKEIFIANRV